MNELLHCLSEAAKKLNLLIFINILAFRQYYNSCKISIVCQLPEMQPAHSRLLKFSCRITETSLYLLAGIVAQWP